MPIIRCYFDCILVCAGRGAKWIKAVATDSIGNTSEHSAALKSTASFFAAARLDWRLGKALYIGQFPATSELMPA